MGSVSLHDFGLFYFGNLFFILFYSSGMAPEVVGFYLIFLVAASPFVHARI